MQNVRFIAINDGADSAKGEDDFTPIRSLFNDFYAKDTSRKVRAVMQAKGRKVLNPTAVRDIRRGKTPRKEPYRRNNNTVRMMLRHKEYAGYTVNFKTYSKSYKLKKRLANSAEIILEIPDTQEAIVPLTQWELTHELLDKKRRPSKCLERQGLFSGLVFCAGCGRFFINNCLRAGFPGATGPGDVQALGCRPAYAGNGILYRFPGASAPADYSRESSPDAPLLVSSLDFFQK